MDYGDFRVAEPEPPFLLLLTSARKLAQVTWNRDRLGLKAVTRLRSSRLARALMKVTHLEGMTAAASPL